MCCPPWLFCTAKETDKKQRAELSERLFGNVARINEMFKYIMYEVECHFCAMEWVIWGSWEREGSHCTISSYSMWFPVPVTSLSIWTSKETVFPEPWKKETVGANQAQ